MDGSPSSCDVVVAVVSAKIPQRDNQEDAAPEVEDPELVGSVSALSSSEALRCWEERWPFA